MKNRLLRVLIRSYNPLVLGVAVGLASAPVWSESAIHQLVEPDHSIIESTRAMSSQALGADISDWLEHDAPHMKQAEAEALELYRQLQSSDPTLKRMAELQAKKNSLSNHKILVFASRSLGEQGLRQIFTTASHNQEVQVIFRGIPENDNLGEAMLVLQQVAAEFDPVPNIVINPVMFKEYGVSTVPTIIVRNSDASSETLPEVAGRVTGLSSPSWLLEQLASGEQGDFGTRGPTEPISEPDLIELIKKRIAKIDWAAQKETAKQRYWENQTFHTYPVATASRIREIDPSVYIQEDINVPNGQTIARKGDIINPLDLRPFTQAVIVFDPTDSRQVAKLQEAIPEIQSKDNVGRITYIATQFNRAKGWDSYKAITDKLDAPVFLLTADVANRFQVQKIPTVITAKNRRFIVEELAIEGFQENDSANVPADYFDQGESVYRR